MRRGAGRHAGALSGQVAPRRARPARQRLARAALARRGLAGAAAGARRLGGPVEPAGVRLARGARRRARAGWPGTRRGAAGVRPRADPLRLAPAAAALDAAGATSARSVARADRALARGPLVRARRRAGARPAGAACASGSRPAESALRGGGRSVRRVPHAHQRIDDVEPGERVEAHQPLLGVERQRQDLAPAVRHPAGVVEAMRLRGRARRPAPTASPIASTRLLTTLACVAERRDQRVVGRSALASPTHRPSASCRVAPSAKRCVPRQRTSRMSASGLSTSISSASVPTSNSATGSPPATRASPPRAQRDHAERRLLAQAARHQVEVARLEDLQLEQPVGKQHRLQREQRQRRVRQEAAAHDVGSSSRWRISGAASLAKRSRQPLDEPDRAVLAAGAADRHREVAALVGLEGRQPAAQEGVDLRSSISTASGCAAQVVGDRRVAAGQRPQLAARSAGSAGRARRTRSRRRAARRGDRRSSRTPASAGCRRAPTSSRIQLRSWVGRSWLVSITVETSRSPASSSRSSSIASTSAPRSAQRMGAARLGEAPHQRRRWWRRGRSDGRRRLRRCSCASSGSRCGSEPALRTSTAIATRRSLLLRARGGGSRAAARAAGCRRRRSRRPRAHAAPPTCPSRRCR